MTSSRIVQLAKAILRHTEFFDDHLQSNGLPEPSFEPGAPQYSELPPSAASHRQAVINLTDELLDLMLGPSGPLLHPDHTIFMSIHAICHFGIAKCFPKGKDEMSYGELASASGLPEPVIRRILRHAMTRRIFQERPNGLVAHTATSQLLADNSNAHDWSLLQTEELLPAATKVVESLEKWKGSTEPQHSGYNVARATSQPFFEMIENDPGRSRGFANSMSFLGQEPGYEFAQAIDNYDWERLSGGQLTVVEVGGSKGHTMRYLAERHPDVQCVVQDLPNVVEGC